MNYKYLKPGLERRLAYSEELKQRNIRQRNLILINRIRFLRIQNQILSEQIQLENEITLLESRQRNFLTFENLSNLEDVIVSSDITKNSISHLNYQQNFCNICQEDIGIMKLVATTYCNHCFHYTCISRHCETSNKCPSCRSIFS